VNVHVIAVPYDSGRRDFRMGRGPGAILAAGLVEQLREAGATVRTIVVEPPRGTLPSEIALTFALQREIARHVADARYVDAFPLVLSGNCSSAVGIVSGMIDDDAIPAVCWFDAHADFNTPETSTSGFLDGMALAILTGGCWRRMSESVGTFRPVPVANVALLGTRDVDAPERDRLEAAPVRLVSADDLPALLPDALRDMRVGLEEAQAYVHVDLDVLDPAEGRVNGYQVPGGLTAGDLAWALGLIGETFPIGAAALTAYDPDGDPERTIARLAVSLAVTLAGQPHGRRA
jgi:arginase